jgi:hypothetical protein
MILGQKFYCYTLVILCFSCGLDRKNQRDVTFAVEGQKSSTIPLSFQEKVTNLNLIVPEFTIISFEQKKSHASTAAAGPQNPFEKISVIGASIKAPAKSTAVSRTFKEITDYNAKSKCENSLNDLSEAKSRIEQSIIICEKEFAALLNSAASVTIDSQEKTSWVRLYSDFHSARLIIHNF